MKIIVYAGDELLTGDAIAMAVLHYSEALAEAGDAGTIEIPVLDPDGSRATAAILAGPASQMIAKDAEGDFEELIDVEVVRELESKTLQLRPAAHEQTQSPEGNDIRWIDDI